MSASRIALVLAALLIAGTVVFLLATKRAAEPGGEATEAVPPPPPFPRLPPPGMTDSAAALHLTSQQVPRGGTVEGALIVFLAPEWHTYGDPPGDSGMAPIVGFSLPTGWSAKRLPLPKPRQFRDALGVTNGYEDRVAIRFVITAPQEAKEGPVDIGISLQWLICNEICVPKEATFTESLTVQ